MRRFGRSRAGRPRQASDGALRGGWARRRPAERETRGGVRWGAGVSLSPEDETARRETQGRRTSTNSPSRILRPASLPAAPLARCGSRRGDSHLEDQVQRNLTLFDSECRGSGCQCSGPAAAPGLRLISASSLHKFKSHATSEWHHCDSDMKIKLERRNCKLSVPVPGPGLSSH